MTTVGLIGSGNIGGVVARLSILGGYDVVLSNSRGPDTLAGLVGELGPKARAATAADAAAAGDLVVVTVPLKAYEQVPVEPLAGKIVIDTNNYNSERDGRILALDEADATTSGLLQAHLPESKVVKAFNTIFYAALDGLARPQGEADRTALPIFGDDLVAKTGVAEFLDSIGYDNIDAGSLADSWRAESGTPAYGAPYYTGEDIYAFQTADAATIRTLLDAARR